MTCARADRSWAGGKPLGAVLGTEEDRAVYEQQILAARRDAEPHQASLLGAAILELVILERERRTVVQQSNGKTLARGERVGVSWRDEDAFQLPGEGR